MMPFNNAMAVFKLLPKTNCRQCEAPTCLAFAAAVFQGRKNLNECPYVSTEDVETPIQTSDKEQPDVPTVDSTYEVQLEELRQKVQTLDLAEAAGRVGGRYANGKLTIKIMGKDFSVDKSGRLYSDIHIHAWISPPFFHYLLNCQGAPHSGNWVPLRELENGRDWAQFFVHRCEKPLKRVADTYTDLFEDMVHLFNGRPVEKHFQSDISLVLDPLPRLPIMICYWKPEDGLSSSLNIFFDANAEKNLPIESIYLITTGLVVMFEKISFRHGVVMQPQERSN